jgi:hypothetical protein
VCSETNILFSHGMLLTLVAYGGPSKAMANGQLHVEEQKS